MSEVIATVRKTRILDPSEYYTLSQKDHAIKDIIGYLSFLLFAIPCILLTVFFSTSEYLLVIWLGCIFIGSVVNCTASNMHYNYLRKKHNTEHLFSR